MSILSEPGSTPLDINFRLPRVPVRVTVWFWVGATFLGWDYLNVYGLGALLVWIACVFFSNLLPIWPLDGGQISRELFTWRAPTNGVRYSLVLSILTAGLLAVNALVTILRGRPLLEFLPVGGRVFVLFFALFAVESFMLLQ